MTIITWLTQVTQTELISQRVDTRKEVERCVDIGWLHSEEACLERIGEAVEKGNCIAWIRNSVDDAIRIYRQLQLSKVVVTENLYSSIVALLFTIVSGLSHRR